MAYNSVVARKSMSFFSSGAYTILHQQMFHMYGPQGPYLREIPVPNKFLPCQKAINS